MSFAEWSYEALAAYLMSEGYEIPEGTTVDELRLYVAELHDDLVQEEEGEVIIQMSYPAMDDDHPADIVQSDDDEDNYAEIALAEIPPESSEKPTDHTALPANNTESIIPVAHVSRPKRRGNRRRFAAHEEDEDNQEAQWIPVDERQQVAIEARYDQGVGEAHIDNFAKPTKLAMETYASLHHPRRMDGKRFNPLSTTMGRYCFRHGGPISSGFDWLAEGTTSELTQYGSGVTLHFKNLKLLFWLCFFGSIIALPQLVLNTQNNANGGGLFVTTLGNLFTDTNNSLVFLCGNSQGYLCDYSIQGLSSLYAVSNLIIVILFTTGLLWMQYFIPKEQKIVSSLFLSVDLYSIWVPKVPAGCGEETLRQFFEQMTGGERVDDVNIAYDDGQLITLFIDRGAVLSELWRVTGRILLEFATPVKPTRLRSEAEMTLRKVDTVERLVEFYDLLLSTYHSLNEQTRNFNKGGSKAISAVVTFSTKRGMMKALEFSRTGNTKQQQQQKFQGMMLRCEPAPPPSTIQWENLEYSRYSQAGRQCLAAIVSSLAIFGSFAANLGSNAYRTELSLADRTLNQSTCAFYNSAASASAMFESNDPCFAYWQARAPIFLFTVMATVVVAAVNFIVGQLAINMAPLEKHHSLISLNVSVAVRLFFAYAINTCFVFILVSFVLHGPSDLDLEWYSNVGTQILLMMLLNVFTPHLLVVYQLASRKYMQWFGDTPLLQREMNERSIGPNFPYAVRSAQIMMQIFVCLVFAPGMPLLYPISMISFALYFIMDKVCVLRLYRTPPEYDSKMASGLAIVMWLGVIGNMLFSIWAYSVPGLFVPASDEPNRDFFMRISLPHTLPLVLACVVVTGLFVLTTIAGLTVSCRRCGGKRKKTMEEELEKEDLPPLDVAIHSGWLRGLKSYNILQNPKYRRAFGVPKSFCDEHSHVNSVTALPEGEGLPELPEAVRQWLNEF